MGPSSAEQAPVPIKDWVTKTTTEHTIDLQKQIVAFLLRAYGLLLIATVAIFIFQGFGLWGFKLPESVLKYIGGATIGEIGGLVTLTIRGVFVKK